MRKTTTSELEDDMRAEYDFSKGVRGKYADRVKEETNVIRLDPDLFALFPDSKSVNDGLRELLRLKG